MEVDQRAENLTKTKPPNQLADWPAANWRREMDTTTKGCTTLRPPTPRADPLLNEVRALRREQAEFRRIFDHFADVFLDAKFPFGKPTDRWARR